MSQILDLRKEVIDKIAERREKHTLSNIADYEAVLLSIFTYINTTEDIEPQKLIEHYLDYKLSVSAAARRDLLDLFKHMVGAPAEPAKEQSEEGKRKWRLI